MKVPKLWLDEPGALENLSQRAGEDHFLQGIGKEIIETGFAEVPGLIAHDLCDKTVNDFHRFVESVGPDVKKFQDSQGRFLRLVNLHLFSQNARKIGLHPTIMNVLDFLFGFRASIYTSLYFEYGTQQPIHRDSPFFETFPRNYFFGVWVALEDIDPASGPLMYIPKGHRFDCDPHDIFKHVQTQNPKVSHQELVNMSLEYYYGQIIERSAFIASPQVVSLNKGDVAIWHPLAPHGGAPATQPTVTRRSMVFHCAPETLQVFQHEVFFSHHSPNPPPARYAYRDCDGRKVALAGDTAFQV